MTQCSKIYTDAKLHVHVYICTCTCTFISLTLSYTCIRTCKWYITLCIQTPMLHSTSPPSPCISSCMLPWQSLHGTQRTPGHDGSHVEPPPEHNTQTHMRVPSEQEINLSTFTEQHAYTAVVAGARWLSNNSPAGCHTASDT